MVRPGPLRDGHLRKGQPRQAGTVHHKVRARETSGDYPWLAAEPRLVCVTLAPEFSESFHRPAMQRRTTRVPHHLVERQTAQCDLHILKRKLRLFPDRECRVPRSHLTALGISGQQNGATPFESNRSTARARYSAHATAITGLQFARRPCRDLIWTGFPEFRCRHFHSPCASAIFQVASRCR